MQIECVNHLVYIFIWILRKIAQILVYKSLCNAQRKPEQILPQIDPRISSVQVLSKKKKKTDAYGISAHARILYTYKQNNIIIHKLPSSLEKPDMVFNP